MYGAPPRFPFKVDRMRILIGAAIGFVLGVIS